MHMRIRQFRISAVGPLMACALALGGCGGVQFEGKMFDAVGLGEKKAHVEKRLPDRAPLIVPPQQNLPQPGPRDQIAQPENWPQEPEVAQQRRVAAAKAKKDEYYEKGNTKDIDEFEKLSDPLSRRPGLLSGDRDEKLSDIWRGDSPQEGRGDSSIIPAN
jgi:hypothetical protein